MSTDTKPIATTRRPTFRAAGSARGAGPRRTTPSAALRDAQRDHRDCSSLGGGAYSDRIPVAFVAGMEYPVGHCDLEALSSAYSASAAAIAKAVGEAIAAGRGTRRPRLFRDDWRGWVVAGSALYRVAAKWPDWADSHEAEIESEHICDLRLS